VEEGKVKMIALSSAKRSAAAPNVPTVAESGYPAFDYDFQLGVFAPAGTPPDIVAKLHQEIVACLRGSRMEATLKARGYRIIGNTPKEYLALMKKETETWATAIERANIERQ
jgi:tripartite-type tricarboxylate transporter receptor subunit TctC